jgi:hypothetical protein
MLNTARNDFGFNHFFSDLLQDHSCHAAEEKNAGALEADSHLDQEEPMLLRPAHSVPLPEVISTTNDERPFLEKPALHGNA